MYFEEEINIVGIISEKELTGTTNAQELQKIINDALCIGPMYEPLIQDLRNNELVDLRTGDIE